MHVTNGLWYRQRWPPKKKVSVGSGRWFEGRHFTDETLLWILYEQLHDAPLHQIQIKLDSTDTTTLYGLIQDFQPLIRRYDTVRKFVGMVEVDEYEQGRHQKGPHGHPTVKKSEIRALFERGSGLCFLEDFEKLQDGHRRRQGPRQ